MSKRVRLTQPLPAIVSGHDARGKFAKGNKFGTGNPLNRRTQRIRAILLGALTDQQAQKIANRLIRMAAGGNLPAIKELLDRTIGKPPAFEILERLEELEALVEARGGH